MNDRINEALKYLPILVKVSLASRTNCGEPILWNKDAASNCYDYEEPASV